jgi:cell division protein FtsQ
LLGNKNAIPKGRSLLSWPIWLITWLAPCLIVMVLLGSGFWWFIRDHSMFHVVAVRVYGTERVPQPELIQLAQISRGMSLLRINVERVRMRLMQHPWIREALVRRAYPNELEIIVYERRPFAVLESGSGYLIDGEGYILSQATPAEASSLPRLAVRLSHPPSLGERLTDSAVEAGLHLLSHAHDSPFFRNAVITHIDIMNPERFVVQTRRGKFILGSIRGSSLVGIDAKLEFFPAIDEALRSSARRAEYVDVSVANQIVVKTSARTTQGAGRLQRRGVSSGQAQ